MSWIALHTREEEFPHLTLAWWEKKATTAVREFNEFEQRARAFAEELSHRINHPVVVETKDRIVLGSRDDPVPAVLVEVSAQLSFIHKHLQQFDQRPRSFFNFHVTWPARLRVPTGFVFEFIGFHSGGTDTYWRFDETNVGPAPDD